MEIVEPLLTVSQLFAKWKKEEEEYGYKPVNISPRTLYRLIASKHIPAHGFKAPLVYESEVVEAFKNSRYRKFGVIDGNPHLGREKEAVAAELERRIKS